MWVRLQFMRSAVKETACLNPVVLIALVSKEGSTPDILLNSPFGSSGVITVLGVLALSVVVVLVAYRMASGKTSKKERLENPRTTDRVALN